MPASYFTVLVERLLIGDWDHIIQLQLRPLIKPSVQLSRRVGVFNVWPSRLAATSTVVLAGQSIKLSYDLCQNTQLV